MNHMVIRNLPFCFDIIFTCPMPLALTELKLLATMFVCCLLAGELATARAVAAAGTIMVCISTFSNTRF